MNIDQVKFKRSMKARNRVGREKRREAHGIVGMYRLKK